MMRLYFRKRFYGLWSKWKCKQWVLATDVSFSSNVLNGSVSWTLHSCEELIVRSNREYIITNMMSIIKVDDYVCTIMTSFSILIIKLKRALNAREVYQRDFAFNLTMHLFKMFLIKSFIIFFTLTTFIEQYFLFFP